jgi:hypothetical protein
MLECDSRFAHSRSLQELAGDAERHRRGAADEARDLAPELCKENRSMSTSFIT